MRSIDVSKNVTPLHIAAGLGHLACLQLLVQQGGNILATDAKQLTPMEYARKNGKDLCLSYLNDVLGMLATTHIVVDHENFMIQFHVGSFCYFNSCH